MMEEYREILLKIETAIHSIGKYVLPQISHLSQVQLTKKQEAILFLYLRNPKITLKEMADYLEVSKSAVTQLVNKLEEDDLLIRTIKKENRREVQLELGEKGQKIKEELDKFEKKVLDEYFTKIPMDDLKQVSKTVEMFEKIVREEARRTK
ncbi:hypothetical protein AJ85_04440 [Alkalihalobacillus alcalophilus ATCC 27647 = CGMCC 1.3604]|uniref:HTH marR-type domain-containing protein n=1 Tax=Alkalihalobacillus alcalophilus ATCC 27647 = CGMCC 1.3604 TaxID=1218173 RepID=A0A094WMV3_ALKAL|nr:MarR family transcriptional regulator [Alkalihalobacillus alcalophilus]KGA97273.1 hypothetical protein BALCAV_0211255 [Alkalihalobacillus alcalophilus ATCC 27647 = CGMCC 1.3604]MED1562796.1 MarR family transcriptional regulator [Alkalihalobacillus alcalophilus]THG91534.1 hypothetical protein AJ85_04440 [Alkalihalobacillus alcalophilus ATCC 27647 = CGMCC 1.3604]